MASKSRTPKNKAAKVEAKTVEPVVSDEIKRLFSLAYHLHNTGKVHEALVIYQFLLTQFPNDFDTVHLAGTAYYQLGKNEEALKLLTHALTLSDKVSEAHSNLGNVLKNLGRYNEAIVSYRRAIRLKPKTYADPYVNLGGCFYDVGRFEEAQEALEQAISLDPNRAETHNNLGLLTKHRNALEAIPCFEKALQIKPDFYDAAWNLSLVQLMAGQYEQGWQNYEYRFITGNVPFHGINQPHWNGEDLTNKTILLTYEQGYGDTLQFCRFVTGLKTQFNAERILLMVQPPLVSLLSYSFADIAEVFSAETKPENLEFDYHAPLLSLPRGFKTTLSTIPNANPYLFVDPRDAYLSPIDSDKLHIGICWAGNPRKDLPKIHEVDLRRSVPLETLKPLFSIPNISWVSLQKDEASEQITPELDIDSEAINQCGSFYETACLIMSLDAVVTVDTAIAHLAGALGKPVIILSRYDQCWRWLQNRNDTPWYPKMRLFRQQVSGDWATVVSAVSKHLLLNSEQHSHRTTNASHTWDSDFPKEVSLPVESSEVGS